MLEYQTKPADAGSRLDVLVSNLYPQFTRSSLVVLFNKNLVEVNGAPEKPAYRVKNNDKIVIDEGQLISEPPKLDIPVIYEDSDVIVMDKPAGILTHSKGAINFEPTVASFLKDKLTDDSLAGNRAGIVHRLDRGTSGVMIAAKNAEALNWLQKQFSQRKVKKQYIAIVDGLLNHQKALIDVPIARNPKRPQTFKVLKSGRSAQTEYHVIKEFKKNGMNYSELEVMPLTGRTHQIRVHLKYIGHPIVGDPVYGRNSRPMLLHAESLELTLPSRLRKTFRAKIPTLFVDFISG